MNLCKMSNNWRKPREIRHGSQREQELNAQTESLQQAAETLRQAADKRFAGAITSEGAQMIPGIAGIGYNFAPSKVSASGALNPDTRGPRPPVADLPAAENRPYSYSEMAEAIARAEREVTEQARDHASELMNQMLDIIRDIREKLSAIEQERTEPSRGIARNI